MARLFASLPEPVKTGRKDAGEREAEERIELFARSSSRRAFCPAE
jgi:hypothetical protein